MKPIKIYMVLRIIIIVLFLNLPFLAVRGEENKCMNSFNQLSKNGVEKIIWNYVSKGPIINSYLRSKKDPSFKVIANSLMRVNGLSKKQVDEIISNLDDLIDSSNDVKSNLIVFRGESRPTGFKLKKGDSHSYPNYISTSINKSLALAYANGANGNQKILYEIHLNKDSKGLLLHTRLPNGKNNQPEMLLPRGSVFNIISVKVLNGVTHIVMELVKR